MMMESIAPYITILRDIFIGCAAITTAVVATLGYKNWNRETRGNADFETARALIRATYKLRDEISAARSPFTSAGEFPEGYSPINTNAKKEAEALAFVCKNRFIPVYDATQEFDAQVLEAEALWGSVAKTKTHTMRKSAHILRISMDTVIRDTASGGRNLANNDNFAKRVRTDVWRMDEEDELSANIMHSVTAIEELVRPHLARK